MSIEYGVCYDDPTGRVFFSDVELVLFKLPEVADIYYGVSSSPIVTVSFILSNFLTDTGYVGNPSGKTYVFETGYTYKYWCIQDEPNSGDRVINAITNGTTNTVLAYDYFYPYYQIDPIAAISITYGKILINGYVYRIYRTITKTSSYNVQYVYSF